VTDTGVGGHGTRVSADEEALLGRLRAGDEAAFASLVERHTGTMLAVAQTCVGTHAVAEEVVQDAWIGVLQGLDRFEGRSSLKTWITRIVLNIARTRGARDARSVPFSSLTPEGDATVVSPERFRQPGSAFAGHWTQYPHPWEPLPEEELLGNETIDVAVRAIGQLPAAQRTVITLRDIEGWTTREVCEALDISEGNERVLLHRARSRVRSVLERHFDV